MTSDAKDLSEAPTEIVNSRPLPEERWKRLRELFEQAMRLEPSARARFIVQACGSDAMLREQLISLVFVSGTEAANPATPTSDTTAIDTENLEAGRMLGRYRILKPIGRGGMGAVYLAERADDQYRQQVAIKIMIQAASATQIVARLRSERQILATLDHPNIARLIDGGTTSSGAPYLVMEYVDGQRIDYYCRDQKLDLRQRLELFKQVCAAVHSAHQRLIVHRDLKPTNILVTASGTPKLLDFGIAKLLDPDATTHNLELTRANERVFTPNQASPEQVRGERIGTVSDVYALGVLLYELLTNEPPFNLGGLPFTMIEDIVCNKNPPKPSVALESALAASSNRLHPIAPGTLRGDLDTMVMKAMHKDAMQRYGSAQALADDIDNYLHERPIAARNDTLGYRTTKFWRRNRMAVVTGSLVLLVIIGLVAYYTWQLRLERDAAERERVTAAHVSDFMGEVFRVANPSATHGKVSAREILDSAVARIDHELQDQPRVRAALMLKMGQAYIGIGLWEPAKALMQRAVDEERRAFGNQHIELADALTSLAAAQKRLDDLEGERKTLEESWTIRSALHRDADAPAIATLVALARGQGARGDKATAVATLQRAESAAQQLAPAQPALLGRVYAGFGAVYDFVGDYAQSEQYYRKALPLLRGAVVEGADAYVDAVNELAYQLTRQGHLVEAQTQLREILQEMIQRLGPDHPLLATLWTSLGIAYCEAGDYAQCQKAFGRSMEIDVKNSPEETYHLAFSYHNLGTSSHDAGDLPAAMQALGNAERIMRKLHGNDDPNMLPALYEEAGTQRDAGNLAEAERFLIEGERVANGQTDKGGVMAGYLATERGRILLARRQYPQAIAQLQHAIDTMNPQERRLRTHAQLALAEAFMNQGQCTRALALLTEATASRRQLMPANWFIADAENRLGAAMVQCGDTNAGAALLDSSLKKLRALRPANDFVVAAAQVRASHAERLRGGAQQH